MAKTFNLTAAVNVQLNNLGTVTTKLKNAFSAVKVPVNVKIDASAIKNVSTLNKDLTSLYRTLGTVASAATKASSALGKLGASTARVRAPKLSKDLTKVNKQTTKLTKTTGVLTNKWAEFGRVSGLAIRRFAGFSIASRAVLGLTSAISESVGEAISFEKELIKISQVTRTTVGNLGAVTSEITKLSTGLGVSSTDLIGISRILAQTGLSARDTKVALEALAKSSLSPTFSDMAKTTEGAIAVMRQFGVQAGQLEEALGSINAVAGQFAVEADDIIAAVRRTGGVFAASSAGVSEGTDALREFIAVFTSVRATTRESAESIATGLRTVFTRIGRSSTIEFLRQYGVELTDLEGKFIGPFKAVNKLGEALAGLDTRDLRFFQITEELGGFRQIGKVIPLLQKTETRLKALRVAQQGFNSLNEDTEQAQKSLANALTKVSEKFSAFIRKITDSGTFGVAAQGILTMATGLIAMSDALVPILPALATLGTLKLGKAIFSGIPGFLQGVSGDDGGDNSLTAATKSQTLAERASTQATQRLTSSMVVLATKVGGIVGIGRAGKADGGRIGLNKGGSAGLVPTLLTPGETVFTPPAASREGPAALGRFNKKGDSSGISSLSGTFTVPGTGNTDKVPMDLAKGSYVVRKSSSENVRQGLNQGGVAKLGAVFGTSTEDGPSRKIKVLASELSPNNAKLAKANKINNVEATIASHSVKKTGIASAIDDVVDTQIPNILKGIANNVPGALIGPATNIRQGLKEQQNALKGTFFESTVRDIFQEFRGTERNNLDFPAGLATEGNSHALESVFGTSAGLNIPLDAKLNDNQNQLESLVNKGINAGLIPFREAGAKGKGVKDKKDTTDIPQPDGGPVTKGELERVRNPINEIKENKRTAFQKAQLRNINRREDQFGRNFNTGGHVGLAADERIAILQDGEAVLQKKASNALGDDTLRSLNKFHTGGIVGRQKFHLGGDAEDDDDLLNPQSKFKKPKKPSSQPTQSRVVARTKNITARALEDKDTAGAAAGLEKLKTTLKEMGHEAKEAAKLVKEMVAAERADIRETENEIRNAKPANVKRRGDSVGPKQTWGEKFGESREEKRANANATISSVRQTHQKKKAKSNAIAGAGKLFKDNALAIGLVASPAITQFTEDSENSAVFAGGRAVGGALGGAAVGAQVGALTPLGPAGGAAVGAIVGGFSAASAAIEEFEKNLKQSRLDDALEAFSVAAKDSTRSLNAVAAAAALAAIERSDLDQNKNVSTASFLIKKVREFASSANPLKGGTPEQQQRQQEAIGREGAGAFVTNAFDQSSFINESEEKLLRQTRRQNTPAAEAVFANIDRSATLGEDTEQSVQSLFVLGTSSERFFDRMAKAKKKGEAEYERVTIAVGRVLHKEAVDRANDAILAGKKTQTAQLQLARFAETMQNLAAATARATDASKRGDSVTASLFEEASSGQVSGAKTVVENPFKNLRGFSAEELEESLERLGKTFTVINKDIEVGSGFLNDDEKGKTTTLAETAIGAKKLQEALPRALTELLSPDNQKETSLQAVERILRDSLGDTRAPQVIDELVDSIRGKINRQTDGGKSGSTKAVLSRGEKIKVNSELITEFSSSSKSSLDALSQIADLEQGQITRLQAAYATRAKQEVAAATRAGELAARTTKQLGLIDSFGRKQTVAEKDAPLLDKIGALTGSRTTDIGALLGERSEARSKLTGVQSTITSGEGSVELLETEKTLVTTINNLGNAIGILSNDTTQLTNIQSKLADIEKQKQDSRGFAERLLTAGPAETLKINNEIIMAIRELTQGDLVGPQLKDALSIIKDAGESFFGKEAAEGVKNRQLGNKFASGVGSDRIEGAEDAAAGLDGESIAGRFIGDFKIVNNQQQKLLDAQKEIIKSQQAGITADKARAATLRTSGTQSAEETNQKETDRINNTDIQAAVRIDVVKARKIEAETFSITREEKEANRKLKDDNRLDDELGIESEKTFTPNGLSRKQFFANLRLDRAKRQIAAGGQIPENTFAEPETLEEQRLKFRNYKRGLKGLKPLAHLNSGGRIPGFGTKDTVPAMLTKGEYVVNAKDTKKNLSVLEQMNSGVQFANSGGLIGYNKGGLLKREPDESQKHFDNRILKDSSSSSRMKKFAQSRIDKRGDSQRYKHILVDDTGPDVLLERKVKTNSASSSQLEKDKAIVADKNSSERMKRYAKLRIRDHNRKHNLNFNPAFPDETKVDRTKRLAVKEQIKKDQLKRRIEAEYDASNLDETQDTKYYKNRSIFVKFKLRRIEKSRLAAEKAEKKRINKAVRFRGTSNFQIQKDLLIEEGAIGSRDIPQRNKYTGEFSTESYNDPDLENLIGPAGPTDIERLKGNHGFPGDEGLSKHDKAILVANTLIEARAYRLRKSNRAIEIKKIEDRFRDDEGNINESKMSESVWATLYYLRGMQQENDGTTKQITSRKKAIFGEDNNRRIEETETGNYVPFTTTSTASGKPVQETLKELLARTKQQRKSNKTTTSADYGREFDEETGETPEEKAIRKRKAARLAAKRQQDLKVREQAHRDKAEAATDLEDAQLIVKSKGFNNQNIHETEAARDALRLKYPDAEFGTFSGNTNSLQNITMGARRDRHLARASWEEEEKDFERRSISRKEPGVLVREEKARRRAMEDEYLDTVNSSGDIYGGDNPHLANIGEETPFEKYQKEARLGNVKADVKAGFKNQDRENPIREDWLSSNERFLYRPFAVPQHPRKGFHDGGQVGGTSVGIDTQPALLTKGEYVVNKQATQANRALLQQINSSRTPVTKFAEGGPVGGATGGGATGGGAPVSSSALSSFASAVPQIAQAGKDMMAAAEKLSQMSIPEKIEITGTQNVNVNVVGMSGMEEATKALVQREITKALAQHINPVTGETQGAI